MKQTVVEWLEKELNWIEENKYTSYIELKIKQAKAMEKEQIIRTHLMARCYDTENSVNEAEQYYKETYESNS